MGSLICFVCLVQPHETAYHSIRGICGEIQNEEITRKFPSVREKLRYWWTATKKQIPSSHNWGCLLLPPNSMFRQAKKNPVTGGGHPGRADSFSAAHITEASGIGKGTSLGQSSLPLSHDLTTLPPADNFMLGIVLRNNGPWQTECLIGWEKRALHLRAILTWVRSPESSRWGSLRPG